MRVGVIGRGFGSRVVAPAFDETEGCQVVEVVSARDDGAVAKLCGRPDVDLVAVHSPPFLHLRHVRLAVGAGHAVLCDKPFGRNAEEAEEMCGLAGQAGVVALVNFQFRYSPGRARLRELVQGGAIGQPEHMQSSTYLAATRVPLRPFGWLFDAELGGGWIGAGGSHTVDFFRWVFGDVEEAWAHKRISVAERPDAEGQLHPCTAEDGFSAVLRSRAGVTAAIDGSFASPVNLPSQTVVVGSDGAVEMLGENTVVLKQAGGHQEEFDFSSPDPHVAIRRWAGVVRDTVVGDTVAGDQVYPGVPTFADGLACACVLDSMRGDGGRISPVRVSQLPQS